MSDISTISEHSDYLDYSNHITTADQRSGAGWTRGAPVERPLLPPVALPYVQADARAGRGGLHRGRVVVCRSSSGGRRSKLCICNIMTHHDNGGRFNISRHQRLLAGIFYCWLSFDLTSSPTLASDSVHDYVDLMKEIFDFSLIRSFFQMRPAFKVLVAAMNGGIGVELVMLQLIIEHI